MARRRILVQTPPPIEVIARAIIRHHDHILVCRNKSAGHRYLPGGHVEFGETGAAAVARELVEECGLRISVRGLALITEECFRARTRVHHEINLVYVATLPVRMTRRRSTEEPPGITSREPAIGFEWIRPAGLIRAGLLPRGTARWLASSFGPRSEDAGSRHPAFLSGRPWAG